MTRMQRSKFITGAAASAVAIVLLGGVAFACIPWYGEGSVAVTDPNGGGGSPANSGVFEAEGSVSNMLYCDSGDTVFPGYDFSAAGEADGGDVVVVSVNATTACGGSQLSAGTNYSVILNNPTAGGTMPYQSVNVGGNAAWSMVGGQGCFTNPTPTGNKVLATNFSVNSNGVGVATYTLPNMTTVNAATNASLLCVGRTSPQSEGIFIPVQIEAVS